MALPLAEEEHIREEDSFHLGCKCLVSLLGIDDSKQLDLRLGFRKKVLVKDLYWEVHPQVGLGQIKERI